MNSLNHLLPALVLSLGLSSCHEGAGAGADHGDPHDHGSDALDVAPAASGAAHGSEAAHAGEAPAREAATHALAQILGDNSAFVREHDPSYFAPFEDQQHPRVTVVACADSRFHTNALENVPDGDIFMVRNIGNQVDSSEGSVEYGVRHLHTPLLLVIGHVGCGAVKAALSDYGEESPPIRHELDGLHLSLRGVMKEAAPFEARWHDGVVENVHRQVANSIAEYADLVRSGRLFVVGGVYDFRDEMGGGRGRLHVVSVNGDKEIDERGPSILVQEARRTPANAGAPRHP